MLTITITGTSIQDIVNQANALTQGTVTTLGEITGQAPAAKPAPAPAAKPAPAPAAKPAPAPAAKPAPAPAAEEGEATITLEQLRAVGKQIIAAGKQAAMKEFLASKGTDSLTNADPANYGEILAGLNAVLNGTSESDGL